MHLDDLGLVLLEGLIAALGFAASWGASKAHARVVDKRLDAIEDRYVTRLEFTNALVDMKESQRETRDDIRRLLEIVSKRGR